MKATLRWAVLVAIPVLVGAGAYDLVHISEDYSADGRPFVRVVSGPAGGTWYPLGAKMTQVFQQEVPEILGASGPGGGMENIRDVHQRNAEIGFSMSDAVYIAYNGRGQFRHPQDNVRHMATAYLNTFQLAVPKNSSIRGIADLKDKNISPGKSGWAGTEMAKVILAAYGITFESIRGNGGTVHHVDFTDSVALMQDGHIDAFFTTTSVPNSSLMELDFEPGIRLLSIDTEELEQLLRSRPGYVRATVPRGTYAHLDQDVQTIGAPVVLLVHKDVSEDLAYRLTKALWEHHDDFARMSPVWKTVKLEEALVGVSAPVHPGAQRFYDEAGVALR